MKKDITPGNEEVKDLLNDIIKKYKKIIKDKLIEIVLIGSYARGDEEEYSDIDIIALIDDSDKNIKTLDRKLEDFNHELTMKYEILVSPILISYSQFREYRDILPFYMNVEKEGVILYERKIA
ncbi:MAG: nucleotidyltransferase domain-containing protein [Candidatus Eremiobacteraeota bacterium]|nr:nucleotidyltransferase domain-containing protein [Candidatus Eremiobacteraeota bacterium]